MGYEIHYIEYSDTGTTFETGSDTTSTSTFMKFDAPSSVATATMYDKTRYYQQELPDVYVVLNPAEANAALKVKRYFPAALIDHDIKVY